MPDGRLLPPARGDGHQPRDHLVPMPGGALTANTQMLRDNNMMDKYDDMITEMYDAVRLGGFGTSVTPVSQFYVQQAMNNVMFGKWKKIAPGYGKMVLGYFGRTPVAPDPEDRQDRLRAARPRPHHDDRARAQRRRSEEGPRGRREDAQGRRPPHHRRERLHRRLVLREGHRLPQGSRQARPTASARVRPCQGPPPPQLLRRAAPSPSTARPTAWCCRRQGHRQRQGVCRCRGRHGRLRRPPSAAPRVGTRRRWRAHRRPRPGHRPAPLRAPDGDRVQAATNSSSWRP
jgi:hypothetical protein